MQVKKSGDLVCTVDLRKFNKASMRKTHYTHTPHNLVPKGQVKTTLDCWRSYNSVLLDKGASDATTFVTECGSYRHLQAPQGFHASGDHYTKRKYEMTKDIKNKREIIDDTLLFEVSLKKLF